MKDDNAWQTGTCWLWCRRSDVTVLWIGVVSSSGMHAPLFACGDCIAELEARIWAWTTRNDHPASET